MSLRDELRQDWDAPSVADEALLESLTGDVRRALCRFVRSEIVEAFDEGVSEGEVLSGRRPSQSHQPLPAPPPAAASLALPRPPVDP